MKVYKFKGKKYILKRSKEFNCTGCCFYKPDKVGSDSACVVFNYSYMDCILLDGNGIFKEVPSEEKQE